MGPDSEVVNAGCNGSASIHWGYDIPGFLCRGQVRTGGLFTAMAVPQLPADIVTIMLGTNGAAGPYPLPVDIYRFAMRETVLSSLAAGAGTVLLMTSPNHTLRGPEVSEKLSDYRDAVLELCSGMANVACGPDLFEQMDLVAHFEGADVHPNALGHAFIAQKLHQSILAVPEPGSGVLLVAGLVALGLLRRR